MSEPLAEIAALIRRESGIVVEGSQRARLEAIVARLVPGSDPSELLDRVAASGPGPPMLDRLIDAVSVRETYFFRDDHELRAIDWRGLERSARAAGDDTVRVWVAGCASGEEAYTLAMLASEALGRESTPVAILATDLSGAAIDAARAGQYSDRSVRKIPPALLGRHFTAEGRWHRIRGRITSGVCFQRHNLVAGEFPPPGELPFHLILCRNVLIYFEGETVRRVVASLESALRPGGELMLGAADRLSETTARLDEDRGEPPAERPAQPPAREFRRPLGVPDAGPAEADGADPVADALAAADAGGFDRSLEITAEILAADPLNADALFVRGLAELGLADAPAAVVSLRRALYIDPAFGPAAFQLGRAYDASGDPGAAERAYRRALRSLESPDDRRHPAIADQVDIAGVAIACRLRLELEREAAPR